MPSLIAGYNYDVFISYRQKDNKYDGWITDFVDHLKAELESTFKEEISVYFDINPHDGLLETHDVDASLREKLKCLVFIPIISRTYCDPRSFAWEHELRAFIEQASADRMGLKVTLPNGNVTSRILPVRIHELNYADNKLCESVLGGMLRSIDFIYKSAGVNRPLRFNEDHPNDNLNKSFYRDQINKVANSVDDIIQSLLKSSDSNCDEASGNTEKPENKLEQNIKAFAGRHIKRNILYMISGVLFLVVLLTFIKILYSGNIENTIALIPLRIMDKDNTLLNDGDNFLEAINDKLNLISNIHVVPRISTLRYRTTEATLDVIRKELNTNYLLDGNIRRYDNKVNIWIELSSTKDQKVLWSKKYVWDKNQIPSITREIVMQIANNLGTKLSEEQIREIGIEPTSNPDANLNYISANVLSNDAWFYYSYGNKLIDSTGFPAAISNYSKAIGFDSLFAQAYARRSIAISWGYYTGQLDSSYIPMCKSDIDKALKLDNDLPDADIARGFYYYYCKDDTREALKYFRLASEKNPDDYQPLFYMAVVYRKTGNWIKSQELLHRVIRFDPKESLFLTNIGLSYTYLHKFDSAIIFHQKAIDAMPQWSPPYENKIDAILLKDGNPTIAQSVLDTAIKNTGDNLFEYRILLNIYKGLLPDALNTTEESKPSDYKIDGIRYLYMALINRYLNKKDLSKIYFDSASVLLNLFIAKNPENHKAHGAIGLAYAGLGLKEMAEKEGIKALDLAGNNSMNASDMKLNLARIYTLCGDYEEASTSIKNCLTNPSSFSENMLKIDPLWAPVARRMGLKSITHK